MMKYKKTTGNVVEDQEMKGRFVPVNHPEYLSFLNDGGVPDPSFTIPEIEKRRYDEISAMANSYILSVYDELSQRKFLSISSYYNDQLNIGNITAAEYATLPQLAPVRNANTWITSIRDVENLAQTDGTLASDVVFPDKPA